MRRLIRFVLGTAAAVALSLGSVAPAYADPEELPADVQAAFSSTALEHLRTAEDSLVTVDETGIPDFSSARAFVASLLNRELSRAHRDQAISARV